MQQNTQQTKSATASKVATVAKPGSKAIFALIAAGIQKRVKAGSRFYLSALKYHAKAKTVFPRSRNDATRKALTVEDVAEVFRLHDGGKESEGKGNINGCLCTLPAGNIKGQAMFDVYMASDS